MDKFIDILKNNYKNKISIDSKFENIGIIKNVLFFDQLKKSTDKDNFNNFNHFIDQIIKNKDNYDTLKNLLINEAIPKDNLNIFFDKLEQYGFDSFDSIINNKTIQHTLDTELKDKTKITTKYNAIKSTIIEQKDSHSCLNKSILKMLEYFNACTFMAYDVFLNIDENYNDLRIYKFNENSKVSNIYLLDDGNKTNIDENKLCCISNVINIVIDSLSELFKKEINHKVDIVLYAVNSKKKFPKTKNEIINNTHVNSGDTIPKELYLHRPMIRIYRNEEFIKVLIHELIHAFSFDNRFGDTPTHNFKIHNLKYKSSSLLFNETITETLAEFINCAIYSMVNNKELKHVLEEELDFGFMQSAKILDHFEFLSIDDFLNNKTDNRKIRQETSAFEYHILKTILLYKFDEFIDIILKNGNTNDLMSLILEVMTNDMEYKNKINTYIQNIKNLPDDLKQTFRMSKTEIYDLDSIPINNKTQIGGTINNNIDYKNKYYKYKSKYLNLL